MKAFRDPVHNLIKFDKKEEKLILDLIDSKEFQRLRHIKQLGLSFFTYFGAEHSRFAHSLGVVHLMKRFINQLALNKNTIKHSYIEAILSQKMLALVAALLHDIGHGPFSHALENTTKIKHEKWTVEIIKGDTEVNQILESYQTGFANQVAEVINRTHDNKAIVKLLSSQLDTDRVDYLLRDSILTGAGYGTFDLEWLIHTLRIGEVNGYVEVGLDIDKGLSIAEDFVMARYYMYKNVYFHKTTRCAELIIDKVFERVLELESSGEAISIPGELKDILTNDKIKDSLNSYLSLVDFKIWYYIDKWSNHNDLTLAMLCKSLLLRNFYKQLIIQEDNLINSVPKFLEIAKREGIDYKYLFLKDNPNSSAYKDNYLSTKPKIAESGEEIEASEQIFLFNKKGGVKELSSISPIINTIRNGSISASLFFVPQKIKEEIINT